MDRSRHQSYHDCGVVFLETEEDCREVELYDDYRSIDLLTSPSQLALPGLPGSDVIEIRWALTLPTARTS